MWTKVINWRQFTLGQRLEFRVDGGETPIWSFPAVVTAVDEGARWVTVECHNLQHRLPFDSERVCKPLTHTKTDLAMKAADNSDF